MTTKLSLAVVLKKISLNSGVKIKPHHFTGIHFILSKKSLQLLNLFKNCMHNHITIYCLDYDQYKASYVRILFTKYLWQNTESIFRLRTKIHLFSELFVAHSSCFLIHSLSLTIWLIISKLLNLSTEAQKITLKYKLDFYSNWNYFMSLLIWYKS